ncbi:MAG: hypothetical protein J6P96_00535 [Bacteroidaceae bacterium]|nr:hypothetical protein [Bacteroidaceae bacterium]
MSDEKGNPLFCGKDVCDALGYTNPQKALRPCGDRGQNGEQIVHRQWDPSDTRQRVRSLLPHPLFQVIK